MASLYLVYDQRDEAAVMPWTDLLFQSFEIVHPLFEGDEREVREAHEETLRNCDGVLIFFGAANDAWLRRKLTEVQKSPGTGRTKPPPQLCVVSGCSRGRRPRSGSARTIATSSPSGTAATRYCSSRSSTRCAPGVASRPRERTPAFANPFPGLRPFEAEEDHLFFGRETRVDDLLRRLRFNRFLAVVGTSGCGKSSLIRCGLVPALHGGQMVKAGSSWRIAIMRPGGAAVP